MAPNHSNWSNSSSDKILLHPSGAERCIAIQEPLAYHFGLPEIMKFRGVDVTARNPQMIIPKQNFDSCPQESFRTEVPVAVHVQGPAIQHPYGVQPVVRPNSEKHYCASTLAEDTYRPVASFRRTKICRPKEHDIFNVQDSCEYRTRYQQEFPPKRGDRFPCPQAPPLGLSMDCRLQKPRFLTSYRDNFPSKYQKMAEPILPPASEMKISVDDMLRMETCHRRDYQLPPSSYYKYRKTDYTPEDNFKSSKEPFESTSTTRGHYRGLWADRPEPIILTDRAEMQLRFSDCPMTFETDTRVNYRPFRIVPSAEELPTTANESPDDIKTVAVMEKQPEGPCARRPHFQDEERTYTYYTPTAIPVGNYALQVTNHDEAAETGVGL